MQNKTELLKLTDEEFELIKQHRASKADSIDTKLIIMLDTVANYITFIKSRYYLSPEEYINVYLHEPYANNRELINAVELFLSDADKYHFVTLPDVKVNNVQQPTQSQSQRTQATLNKTSLADVLKAYKSN